MKTTLLAAGLVFLAIGSLSAQHAPGAMSPPGGQGSSNVRVLAHVPLGSVFTIGDIEVEQELSRPYSYVPRLDGTTHSAGMNIISLKDPSRARSIYYWQIDQPELHQGIGGLQNKYFKLKARYYDAQSFQFAAGSPDNDMGAVILDVTALPDTTRIKEVGRIRSKADARSTHRKNGGGQVVGHVDARQANQRHQAAQDDQHDGARPGRLEQG